MTFLAKSSILRLQIHPECFDHYDLFLRGFYAVTLKKFREHWYVPTLSDYHIDAISLKHDCPTYAQFYIAIQRTLVPKRAHALRRECSFLY